MKKIVSLMFGFLLLIVLLSACSKKEEKPAAGVSIANPASVNCVNNGGKLKILENDKGQYGICTLPDGTECDEWAYYREECPKKQNNASCREQNGECCKGIGENISCVWAEVACAAGYEQESLGCDMDKCTPKLDCIKSES